MNAVIVHLDSMLVMSVGGKDTGLGSAGAVEIPAMSTQLLTLSVKNLLRHDWRRQVLPCAHARVDVYNCFFFVAARTVSMSSSDSAAARQ